jgi:hypothetical protein
MKLTIILIGLMFLAGCSNNAIIRVRNCVPIGGGLFECEEVPPQNMDNRK